MVFFKLLSFKVRDKYEVMNEQQRAIWESAIKAIFERQSWLATSGSDIISWLTYNQAPASGMIRANQTQTNLGSPAL